MTICHSNLGNIACTKPAIARWRGIVQDSLVTYPLCGDHDKQLQILIAERHLIDCPEGLRIKENLKDYDYAAAFLRNEWRKDTIPKCKCMEWKLI